MKINFLNNYKPQIFKINNVNKVLCLIRKSFINYTDEERIRQAFIYFLITEIKVPLDRIELEKKVKSVDNIIGRIDIIVYDEYDDPFIIYECKREMEYFTDDVYMQGLRYFTGFDCVAFVGFVIGEEVILYEYKVINDKIENFELATHPTYQYLHSGGEVDYIIEDEAGNYNRLDFINPIAENVLKEFYELGIFGKKTSKELIPFMINFYNWMYDVEDKLQSQIIIDIGLKYTKFGNAVGTFNPIDFRTFIMNINQEEQLFSLAFTSMKSGENVEFGTGLLVGIENSKTKHSCLQLRIETSVKLINGFYEIWHNGSITVGKIGSAKRKDLVNFVRLKSPHLVINEQIYLGKFQSNIDIKSNSIELSDFLTKLFDYCILRDEFRDLKKSGF